jgi:hypothetical protein
VLPTLTLGFELHEEVISEDVLFCIRTILKLQDLTASDSFDSSLIEDLQTRIEGRLVFQEQSCKELGPIAECCRVAVYIVSYMSNPASWSSAFVPLRLAEKLLNQLDKTSTTVIWQFRRDLFLWLLLVGASTGRGENCFAKELAAAYQDFIERITDDVNGWTDLKNGPRALHNVMKRFLYTKDWVAERHQIPRWTKLERAVFLRGSEDVDIDMDTEALLRELVPDTNLFE